nr:hypothetical protein L203_00145 [Cryptococcus depauperatus CBS 7841]
MSGLSRGNPEPQNKSKAEEEDDEDLSDLDDVLESFNGSQREEKARSLDDLKSMAQVDLPESNTGKTDEDFEAALMEDMESLLRQLAGDHPPEAMPDSNSREQSQTSTDKESQDPSNLSIQTEEQAWQKAVDMLLSGEGFAALGLNDKENKESVPETTAPKAPLKPSGSGTKGECNLQQSYEETLRKTLESLKSAGQKGTATDGAGDVENNLSSLLASLGGDPDLLKNLNLEDEGDGDFEGVLEGMMAQLMTKEVLEDPMAELASKYPAYLESPPAGTPAEDLEKHRKQYVFVRQIMETFKKPEYSDETHSKEVAKLVSDMQDLGGPPKEIMGDLPEGFASYHNLVLDLGAFGNEEGCIVM